MPVPTIALYASPPSSVCSTAHPCQINSYEYDLNSRSSPASSSSSVSPSPGQKPIIGGLSRLLSPQPAVKHASYSSSSEEFSASSLWHDRGGEELGCCSFRYSSLSSSLKRDQSYQSPVSVLQSPASGSCGSGIGSAPLSMSPSTMRMGHSISSVRAASGGLFNRFVRHALGSCVDYDSPCFEVHNVVDSASGKVDELTFDMEDNVTETTVEPYAKDLLLKAQCRHRIFYDEVVVKAFYEAEKAHRGQVRASGDPYLQHCVETAVLLALIGANSTVVAAGLLHDTLDDAFVTYDYIFQTFGAGVADLVEGVSKLSQLSKLARENNTAWKTVEADRLHTMFLAMADARAVLIKLADRLHNMMTLDALSLVKQQRFSKETLEIFAPLANRLGIFTWKEQLENLCFKFLYPDHHRELSSRLVNNFNEAIIISDVEKLEQVLKKEGIAYHDLSGRHKSLYSIYVKMTKKNLNMDEIHDIHGIRLIVENEDDCYKALKIVHRLWCEVPGRFKDYIAKPKFNGYQSLHTVVMGEGTVPLEVQIRTKEMHLQAEYGFAAHWRYKEGSCKLSNFVLQMVEWARWIVTWQCETMNKYQKAVGYSDTLKPPCQFPNHSEDCPYSCRPYCGPDGPVFVIMIENDKMSVQEFPANSTIKDMLERAGLSRWTHYGFSLKEELRPKLNHAPIGDLTCKLKMGDVVELTPALPDKSLVEYREKIQRMYNRGLVVPTPMASAVSMVGSRS